MSRIGGSNGVEKPLKKEEASQVVDGTNITGAGTEVDAFNSYAENKHYGNELDSNAALIGLAARLRRDTVVILRLAGEDLEEFVGGPEFDEEVASAYSLQEPAASLRERVRAALALLTVEHGMPPSSDPSVIEEIVGPAMAFVSSELLEQPISLEGFAIVYRKIVEGVAQRLKEHPVIVAYCEDTFDGSDINRLVSDKHGLDKLLHSTWKNVAKDNDQLPAKDFLNNVVNKILLFAGLPPYGTVSQLDASIDEIYKHVSGGSSKVGSEEEFKSVLKNILQNIMHKLEKNPISISSTTVVNERSCQPL